MQYNKQVGSYSRYSILDTGYSILIENRVSNIEDSFDSSKRKIKYECQSSGYFDKPEA